MNYRERRLLAELARRLQMEDPGLAAWLAMQCSKTAVTELMRIAWRTVGAIITRVSADLGPRGSAGGAAADRDR